MPQFQPSRTIFVYFGSHRVALGELMPLADVKSQPRVEISANGGEVGDDLYTMVRLGNELELPARQPERSVYHYLC